MNVLNVAQNQVLLKSLTSYTTNLTMLFLGFSLAGTKKSNKVHVEKKYFEGPIQVSNIF